MKKSQYWKKSSSFSSILLIFLFGAIFLHCSEEKRCINNISSEKLDPNNYACTNKCDCNNQIYEGECINGRCVAYKRDLCEGKTVEACLQKFTSRGCKIGIHRCHDNGLESDRYGDCLCHLKEETYLEKTSIRDGSSHDYEATENQEKRDTIKKKCQEGVKRNCYTGPPKTKNIGACRSGYQICQNGYWGPCLKEQLPSTEICNEKDDDCDGKLDNIAGNCRDTTKKGICQIGRLICINEQLGCRATTQPQKEICNGLDDNCDGLIDNTGSFCPTEEVFIQSGTFIMGSPRREIGRYNQEDQHQVTLTHSFYLWKYEVSEKEFQKIMGYNPAKERGCGDLCPAMNLSWHEAAAFCNKLSKKYGLPECYDCIGAKANIVCQAKKRYLGPNYYECKGYRLPTEAEWEYAYRAGTTTAYYNGQNTDKEIDPILNRIAWYKANSGGKRHKIGQKPPNHWGLYDMAGNVCEWIYDTFRQHLGKNSVINPVHYRDSSYRIYRGGSWHQKAYYCRASFRYGLLPNSHYGDLGLRPARTFFVR